MTGDRPSKIPAGVPAYTDNIVLNFSEWFAVTTIVLFLSTFYVEFKNIKLSLNVVIEQGEDEVTQEEEVKKLLEWFEWCKIKDLRWRERGPLFIAWESAPLF